MESIEMMQDGEGGQHYRKKPLISPQIWQTIRPYRWLIIVIIFIVVMVIIGCKFLFFPFLVVSLRLIRKIAPFWGGNFLFGKELGEEVFPVMGGSIFRVSLQEYGLRRGKILGNWGIFLYREDLPAS